MSYIYSQVLVAEYSAANCSGTDAFAQSNGSPTPNPSWWHDRTMAVSRHSRFGMTFSPLTESHGADVLTWWLEGFPVRTSALPERAQESTEPGAECGGIWLGWLAKFDPASSSWKTAQLSLIGDSEKSLATFPRSGMTRGGLLWELPMLERTTNETGSGFFPTPVASDTSSRTKPYAQGGTPLSLAVKLWPTPTVCGNYNRKGASATSGDGLATAVRMWPTPTAHNAKETNAPSEALRNTPTLAAQAGGPLNPDWTEWLMGWPIGWTALKPSETVKFQPVLPQPGKLLEGLEA